MSGCSWMGLLMDDTKGRWCKNALLQLGYVIYPVAIHLHLLAGVHAPGRADTVPARFILSYFFFVFLWVWFSAHSEASLRWRLNAATKTKVTNSISFPLIQQPKQVLSPASLGGTFAPCLSGSLKRVFEGLDSFMLFTKNTFKCFMFTGVKEIKKIKVP